MSKVRLDRFLWATRQFKSRSLSTDACKRNWITVNNLNVKASKEVKVGDLIQVKFHSHRKTIKIINLLDQRVGANKVMNFILDLTPPEEQEKKKKGNKKRQNIHLSSANKGRPSKKQRRDLDEFLKTLLGED